MKKLIELGKKFLMLTIIMLIVGLIFQSCEKQDAPAVDRQVEQQSREFTVKDGVLVFNTVADFINVKGRVVNFSESEREMWEKEIGFKSQRTIFNEIVQAEAEIDIVNQSKYSYAEAKSLDPAFLHSDLYNKYLKAGVIQVIMPVQKTNIGICHLLKRMSWRLLMKKDCTLLLAKYIQSMGVL